MDNTLRDTGLSPVAAAEDRVGPELRRLLREVRREADGPAAEHELLRRRTRFFLTRLAMLGAEDAHPEAAELRRWLVGANPSAGETGRPAGAAFPAPVGAPGPTRTGTPVVFALAALVVAALVVVPLGAVLLSYRTYVVLTGSMAPALPVGTLLVVEPVAAARVSVGDVVTFPHPDRPAETVTHRVARIDDGPLGRFLQTKGDANPVPDAWRVPASGEVWRVALAVPQVGRVYQAAADPSARLGLLVLPSLFLGGLTLMNLWRGERRVPAPV